jgi:hypothetical protein
MANAAAASAVQADGAVFQDLAAVIMARLPEQDRGLLRLLITGYRREAAELYSTLVAARTDVTQALARRDPPNPDEIRLLLYPDQDRVAQQAEAMYGAAWQTRLSP